MATNNAYARQLIRFYKRLLETTSSISSISTICYSLAAYTDHKSAKIFAPE